MFNKKIDVDALVSDRYPLRDLPVAVEMARSTGEETYKILIYP